MNNDINWLQLGIRKQAGNPISKMFDWFGKGATSTAAALVDNAKTSLMIGAPATIAILAWLAHKATSPEAVAENATDYAINAAEKESLVQSIRDFESLKQEGKLKKVRRHDQFL